MENKVSLKQLEIFNSVVVAGSITKAARLTGLSQPSISQHLAKLEESLGIQLLHRNRAGHITLSAAGEYWFKTTTDLLSRYNAALVDHQASFGTDRVTIRLGTTPTLRGRFVSTVAKITLGEDSNARFEQFWGMTSGEVVDRLRMHQINCAIVNATSLEKDHSSYKITPMFHDTIAWVVPKEVPLGAIRDAVAGDAGALKKYPALSRYVRLSSEAPLQPASDDWYRNYIPSAQPTFSTMTYIAAVELAVDGLATTHCPISLLPNLPESVQTRLYWFAIDWIRRKVVLAMPKHLLTLPTYARIYAQMQEFAQKEYSTEMYDGLIGSFSDLL